MKINVIYTKLAQEDLSYWEKNNKNIFNKIHKLISAITENPFEGIGKPEPLRFEFKGYWSRRIDQEHRLVYKVHDDTLYIVQCRYHY